MSQLPHLPNAVIAILPNRWNMWYIESRIGLLVGTGNGTMPSAMLLRL
jgi:hypothetical protein